jgi:hypothetical protein
MDTATKIYARGAIEVYPDVGNSTFTESPCSILQYISKNVRLSSLFGSLNMDNENAGFEFFEKEKILYADPLGGKVFTLSRNEKDK